jgi:hypothetical protein
MEVDVVLDRGRGGGEGRKGELGEDEEKFENEGEGFEDEEREDRVGAVWLRFKEGGIMVRFWDF